MVALLSHREDWRLAFVAAQSLGRMGDPAAIKALQEKGLKHWFPIVQQAARKAIAVLEAPRSDDAEPQDTWEHALESYVFVDRSRLTLDAPPQGLELGADSLADFLMFVEFLTETPEVAEEFIRVRNTNGVDFLKRGGLVHRLAFEGGFLIGASAGEWTGSLQFVDGEGEHQLLRGGNFVGIEFWQDKVIVAEGSDHMGMNEGMLYEVRVEEGKVVLSPWFVLPGCPHSTWLTRHGWLVVSCEGGMISFPPAEGAGFRYDSM